MTPAERKADYEAKLAIAQQAAAEWAAVAQSNAGQAVANTHTNALEEFLEEVKATDP